ncbi:leucine-rich repeat domain-containing protein [candidate division KSB1 bacterium]|nr:leucine-rich repeat domain-containing protein [candidate division KSB1 bacterium]
MQEKRLYDKLKAAYSEKNLHHVTTRVIQAFRGKQYGIIRKMMQLISDGQEREEKNVHKIFAGLIMRYHPDRLQHYLQEIEKYPHPEDEAYLQPLSHLLTVLETIDSLKTQADEETDSEWADEDAYAYDEGEFDRIIDLDETDVDEDLAEAEEAEMDFVTALEYKEYGNLGIAFQRSDLENTEGELALTNAGISDLSGVEYCRNLTVLDLSQNDLVDVTRLGGLEMLEELYLAENDIFSIDSLAFLTRLKKLDIAFNHIEDISVLFDLPELEYLNIMGNKIAKAQITRLQEKGVTVVH